MRKSIGAKILPVFLSAPRRSFGSQKESAVFTFTRDFKAYLTKAPENKLEASKDELLEYFKSMAFFRRLEIVADTLYKQRAIRGFCHLYDGQEACIVGMEAALKKTDSVITAYRDHCHQVSRGDTPGHMMAELLGKSTGSSHGKGGSMHLYYPPGHFYGGNGIVGAQVPIGAGLAFAHKYKGDGGLAVTAYGDGAANQGQIFEAANMAALWKLPLILVCENNQYGMGTSVGRASSNPDFYNKGASLLIPGLWVDGMDVLAVKKGFAFAAEHCRSGKGPIFLELNTYRYHGHSMSDPGVSYRTREEVAAIRSDRDCVDLVKNRLLENKWATAADIKAVDKEIRRAVDEAVEFAQKSPVPKPEELYTDVYKGDPPPFIRAVDLEDSVKFASS